MAQVWTCIQNQQFRPYNCNPMTQLFGFRQVMSRKENSTTFITESFHQFSHFLSCLRVQPCSWLIQKKDFRLVE